MYSMSPGRPAPMSPISLPVNTVVRIQLGRTLPHSRALQNKHLRGGTHVLLPLSSSGRCACGVSGTISSFLLFSRDGNFDGLESIIWFGK